MKREVVGEEIEEWEWTYAAVEAIWPKRLGPWLAWGGACWAVWVGGRVAVLAGRV
jgi:hypothetical protein